MRAWQQSVRRMAAIAKIELIRLVKDRASLSLVLAVPAVQMILFGYTVNLNPRDVRLAVTTTCLDVAPRIDDVVGATGYFHLPVQRMDATALTREVQSGRMSVGLECRGAELPRIVVDGSDPAAVRPAVYALQSAILRMAASEALDPASAQLDVQWLYDAGTHNAWFLAPGLIGVIVMISMLMLGAMSVVREREQGTWEGLLATPASALDALVGKLSPYVAIAAIQAITVTWSAHWLFDLPLRGDLGALFGTSALLAFAHLVLGFAFSSLATTQLQAIQAAVFFYLPSMLLSGFMFPFSGMPLWAQFIGNMLPLTHFVRAARGVLLKGYGIGEITAEIHAITIFSIVAVVTALCAYRRRLD